MFIGSFVQDGVWDFGNLRCEGPVCEDPGRPADGRQQSDSYEQGSKVITDDSCGQGLKVITDGRQQTAV